MSRVYLDATAIKLGGGETPAGSGHPAPRAVDAIGNLREAGHEVLLFRDPTASAEDLSVLASLAGLTVGTSEQAPGPGSWLITADPRHCERRLAGVRTILVGPRRPPGPRPTAHCDAAARDLTAAAIEILTREAMS
jgi:hypothetical protein